MAENPRLKLPKEAKKGDVIEIKTLLAHIMESGQRKDKDGKTIPRKIINKFTCEFNGKPVFTANLEPAIAANPYLQFFARVEESGTFKFSRTDDRWRGAIGDGAGREGASQSEGSAGTGHQGRRRGAAVEALFRLEDAR